MPLLNHPKELSQPSKLNPLASEFYFNRERRDGSLELAAIEPLVASSMQQYIEPLSNREELNKLVEDVANLTIGNHENGRESLQFFGNGAAISWSLHRGRKRIEARNRRLKDQPSLSMCSTHQEQSI